MAIQRCVLICGLMLVCLTATPGVHAQEVGSRFRKQHIRGTETILIEALRTKPPVIQRGILQHIRFLEWAYPDEEFGAFVKPLSTLLMDEKADLQVRMLAALALEGLHSSEGDEAIKTTAGSSTSGLQELCTALMAEPLDGR